MNPAPHLVDVDFPQWRPGDQYGGWIETAEDRSFGTAFPDEFLIPRSEWKDRIEARQEAGHSLKKYHPYVYNQSPESSCVYNAAAGCLTIRRNIQLGLEHQIILSPMSGYCRVAGHRHSGSTMWGALGQLSEGGLLPSSNSNYGDSIEKNKRLFKHLFHENTPFSRSLPSGWEQTGRHFRVLEWFRIDSKDQFGSALLQDMPICYGRAGHSICAEDLMISSRYGYLVSYCDSYSTSRGDDGRLYDTESKWATGGAWCPRVITYPDDPSKPAGEDTE